MKMSSFKTSSKVTSARSKCFTTSEFRLKSTISSVIFCQTKCQKVLGLVNSLFGFHVSLLSSLSLTSTWELVLGLDNSLFVLMFFLSSSLSFTSALECFLSLTFARVCSLSLILS